MAVGEKNCPSALWGVRRGLAHARGAIWGISLVFYRGIRRGLGNSWGATGALPGARGDAEGHSNRIWPAFCPILTPDRTPTGARRTAPTGTGRDRYPFAAVTGRHPGGGLAWWLQIPMSLPPLPLSPPPPTSYLDGSLNARFAFWVELDLFACP